MSSYVVQEILSLLLVIAAATGTFLVFALSFILLQEGMRRAARWLVGLFVGHRATSILLRNGGHPGRTDARHSVPQRTHQQNRQQLGKTAECQPLRHVPVIHEDPAT